MKIAMRPDAHLSGQTRSQAPGRLRSRRSLSERVHKMRLQMRDALEAYCFMSQCDVIEQYQVGHHRRVQRSLLGSRTECERTTT